MADPRRLCGMCGIACGIACGNNSLIPNALRHVRHASYVGVRAHARTPACAHPRAHAHARLHAAHDAHGAQTRSRAAHHPAQAAAHTRARFLTPHVVLKKAVVVP